jgi:protein TonB
MRSIRLDMVDQLDVKFLLGSTQKRIWRSIAASFGVHAVAIGLVLFLTSLESKRVFEGIEPSHKNYSLVWLPAEGLGGGGGGGGNQSLELPRLVEREGVDETKLSVPVAPEPNFVEPDVEPEPLETARLNIPVVSMAASLQTFSGIMEAVTRTTLSQGSGTGGGGGTGQGAGIGSGDGSGLGPGEGGGAGGGIYRPGSGIVNPQLIYEVEADYTAEAMRAQINGIVWVEAVVLSDGTVGDITVVKSLDRVFGLDDRAVESVRQWRFAPGTRFGEPVAVLVLIEVFFNLF